MTGAINNINVSELMDVFEQNKQIFRLIDGASEYIDYCSKLIMQLYDDERKTIFKSKSFELLFSKDINFKTFTIHLNFDIKKAIDISRGNIFNTINSDKFNSMYINYDCIHNVAPQYALIEAPIILVPFNFNGYNYLVIDGNHRISAKIKCRGSKLNIVVLSVEDTIQLFKSEFEKAIYLFIQDGLYLSELLQKPLAKFECKKCMIEKAFIHQ